MRILELQISNVRGVLDLPLLRPNGRNFLICGPNASGKSAVVDAIDFLLTGRISRLTGPGTRGIKIERHGPHVDRGPENALVRALVRLRGLADPVEISRGFDRPEELKCPKAAASEMERVQTLAQRGHHLLTRRHMLRFITTEPADRAQQVGGLLELEDVSETRAALVTAKNKASDELKSAVRDVKKAEAHVREITGLEVCSPEVVLAFANEQRGVLGEHPMDTLEHGKLREGLTPASVLPSEKKINLQLLESQLKNLWALTGAESQKERSGKDAELRDLLNDVKSDAELQRRIDLQRLTELGIGLIDQSGDCPLCDSDWAPGELTIYLEGKLESQKAAAQKRGRIETLAAEVAAQVDDAKRHLKAILAPTETAGLAENVKWLSSWLSDLQALSNALAEPLETYPDPRFSKEAVGTLVAPADAEKSLAELGAELKGRFPEASPEQTAWDTLVRLAEQLKALEDAQGLLGAAEVSGRRSELLLQCFEEARNAVLGELYESVKDRFVELYRRLHPEDEQGFDATIEPQGAGLGLEVDFYGRGRHPPHALHSEGHQDSMGLCLYLALAEQLTQGVMDLVILDDVIMSIDADHRRQVCALLKDSFPHRQFLITTHDKTWARQLGHSGVVDSAGTVEFFDWHIDGGPKLSYRADLWERIETDLQANQVPNAAWKLRWGSEEFLSEVCDALGAEVTYRLDGRLELGHYLPAAVRKYKELLKAAKKAANSWNDAPALRKLNEQETTAKAVCDRVGHEQWAVNPNVHYSNWASFSAADFRPVVEAFRALFGLFCCAQCGRLITVLGAGPAPQSVQCPCSTIRWNLKEKGQVVAVP